MSSSRKRRACRNRLMVYNLFSCTRGGEPHIQSPTLRFHIHKQATTYKTNRFILLGQRRALYQFMASAMLMEEFDSAGQLNDRVIRKTAPRKMVGTEHRDQGLNHQAQESRSLFPNDFLCKVSFNNPGL